MISQVQFILDKQLLCQKLSIYQVLTILNKRPPNQDFVDSLSTPLFCNDKPCNHGPHTLFINTFFYYSGKSICPYLYIYIYVPTNILRTPATFNRFLLFFFFLLYLEYIFKIQLLPAFILKPDFFYPIIVNRFDIQS